MRGWTVRRRIAAAFSIMILVTIAVGVMSYRWLDDIRDGAESLKKDSLPGMALSSSILSQSHWHFSLVQRRHDAPSAAEQAEVDAALATTKRRLDESVRAYAETIVRVADRALYERLRQSYDAYIQTIPASLASRDQSPAQTLRKPYERLIADAEALVGDNQRAGSVQVEVVTTKVRHTEIATTIAIVLTTLLGAVAGLLLFRSIAIPLSAVVRVAEVMRQGNFSTRVALDRQDELGLLGDAMNRLAEELGNLLGDVQKNGIQVNSSATEIAATAREQQATANEIAATTAEIGATSREISATAKELSKTMNDVVRITEHAATVAVSGQAGIVRMQETMQQVIDASSAVTGKLADVNEKAANISLVVTTITKVADQTNLLSLNAAIEAEKAGEYGRGFSVVASEIRRLADQTAMATLDIEKTVGQMQSSVAAGVMSMEKFGDQVRTGVGVVRQVGDDLQSITEQVQTLAPSFETVNEGMQGQAKAAEQISETLAQLTDASRQTVESLRQSNDAIEQLNNVTRALRQSVSRFTVQG